MKDVVADKSFLLPLLPPGRRIKTSVPTTVVATTQAIASIINDQRAMFLLLLLLLLLVVVVVVFLCQFGDNPSQQQHYSFFGFGVDDKCGNTVI